MFLKLFSHDREYIPKVMTTFNFWHLYQMTGKYTFVNKQQHSLGFFTTTANNTTKNSNIITKTIA